MATTVFVWRGATRWLCYAPGRLGASGDSRLEAISGARRENELGRDLERPLPLLQFVDGVPPGCSR
jgi:hypothetical protein